MDPVDRIDGGRTPRVGCIIQARLDSTRLCHKVFRRVHGHCTVLDCVLDAALNAKRVGAVWVTTPDVAIYNYVFARGSLTKLLWAYPHLHEGLRDPLQEYFTVSLGVLDVIVRLTADCPMITGPIIDAAVEEFLGSGADYGYNGKDGADVEVFTFEALAEAHEKAGPDEHEHVTTWIRRHKRCVDLTPPAGEFLSLNTPEEYERICELMAAGPNGPH